MGNAPQPDSTISSAIRELMREHIESYVGLELLLLLFQSRGQPWSSSSAADALRTDPNAVAAALEQLARHELVVRDGRTALVLYRYPEQPGPVDETVAELARIHSQDRLAIMRVMNSQAIDRLRTSALRAFAEAFRIRGGRRG